MSYTFKNYQTKKQLKQDVKDKVVIRCYQPGLGPDLSSFSGPVHIEGPHFPKIHRWYAKGTLKNGVLVEVS